MPESTRLRDLLDRYDAVLLDAYGVLNDAAGALPGAAALIAELERRQLPWAVVTNDASRLPATVATRLTGFGVPVPAARVVTAGMLLAPYFAAHDLVGARCVVLGTAESRRYVADAGGLIVSTTDRAAPIDAVIVCDDGFAPFLEEINATLSAAARALDGGGALALVLPNPDLIFPRPGGDFGITSGAIALVLEAALARRHPGAPRFVPLGKPEPTIFEAARRHLRLDAAARTLVIGDQLDTDIAGARNAGLDAALVAGGISAWRPGDVPTPTWLLPSLVLEP